MRRQLSLECHWENDLEACPVVVYAPEEVLGKFMMSRMPSRRGKVMKGFAGIGSMWSGKGSVCRAAKSACMCALCADWARRIGGSPTHFADLYIGMILERFQGTPKHACKPAKHSPANLWVPL